jgi:lipooligosaccharide transport system permease protein
MRVAELAPVRASTGLFARFREAGTSTLLVAVFNPIFVLGAMGLGLGSLIDGQRAQSLGGIDYLSFLAPGLMAAFAMQGAAQESLWPVLGGVKWMRTYHAAVSTPVSAGALFAGHVIWICLRVLMSATVFLIVAVILGGVPSWWGVLAIPAAVLGASVFAAALNGYAVTQESDIPFAVILRMGLFPLFLFSGTFFPTSRLPDWLQPVSWFSPLWHAVELCRAATTGSAPSAGSVVGHVAFLVVGLAAGCWWGVRRFNRALTA